MGIFTKVLEDEHFAWRDAAKATKPSHSFFANRSHINCSAARAIASEISKEEAVKKYCVANVWFDF